MGSSAAIPSSLICGGDDSRALNRGPYTSGPPRPQRSSLSLSSLILTYLPSRPVYTLVKAAEQTSPSNSPIYLHIRQWLSAQKPRPSSDAPATRTTATTTSPRPTPQTRTSDGPATFTGPASPCLGPSTANHRRRSTKSISIPSASPMPGDARAFKANTRPWAHEHPADCLAQRRAGAAVGTAGRRA